ncbi:MAG: hypothetical protein GXO87_11225 [Chlorobi bacterium]|nr:hypothetical protein [Chlorobiota bacterium]
MKFKIISALSLIVILFSSSLTNAWVYPEHRDIAIRAIEKLSANYRTILDKLWAEARIGYETRLPAKIIDGTHGFIDWPSWSAISGDHSCSPANMLHNVLDTEWIVEVADIAQELKENLAKAETRSELINYLRDSDIKLQRADEEYAIRAGSNNAHFLIARPRYDISPKDYGKLCLKEGSEINAIGVYAYFHAMALKKISLIRSGEYSAEERSQIVLSAFSDEAFALHFLEDTFAAGHVAGTWGDASQRKGTHDYYNENGLEVITWNNGHAVIMGDAHMRPEDVDFASDAVKLSIEQFLDASENGLDTAGVLIHGFNPMKPGDFSVCKNNFMPKNILNDKLKKEIIEVVEKIPISGLGAGLGALPRFRSELGLFIGFAPSFWGESLIGGFGELQTKAGAYSGIGVALRLGVGLDGVMNDAGDGLVFLDLGWRQDGNASMKFGDSPNLSNGGSITSAIPGRDAYTARLRMPFWLIPGDMVLALPLALISMDTYSKMAVIAGNGGVIPWQSGISTPIGRFQFVLGREVGVSFYSEDALLIPVGEKETKMISYKSIKIDAPILEYKPFRTFSLDQSSGFVIQLTVGVDIPFSAGIILPENGSVPQLKNVWSFGLRTIFDWRYYY